MRIFLCNVFVGVCLFDLGISFSNWFWIVWILFILVSEQFPYTSIPNFILGYINAWYIWRAIFVVALFLIWLNIPKYFKSDLHNLSTCSFQFKVSSRVTPRYWNESNLCISIYSVFISVKSFGIGLFIVRNKTKLVFSAFIINLLYLQHLQNSFT